MQLLTIFSMLFAVGGVLFALQNHGTVAVSLFAWHFEASLAVVLLLTLALGGVIVALISTPATLRRQWTIKRQQKRIDELELRVDTLQRETAALQRSARPIDAGVAATSPYKEMPTLIAGDTGRGKPGA